MIVKVRCQRTAAGAGSQPSVYPETAAAPARVVRGVSTKRLGRKLQVLMADLLILAGVIAIVAFLWGFSEGAVYQYVQGIHLNADAADGELDSPILPNTTQLSRPQPPMDKLKHALHKRQLLPTLAMMLNRDPLLVGKLEVQRLGFSVLIRDGVDAGTLRKAAGHLSGSAMPGEAGDAVVLAHRDTFFRPLRDLRTGDSIYIRTARGGFTYTVDSIVVVAPESLHLEQGPEPVLTLITCYPFTYTGPAPRRFVVRARLQS